MSFEVRGESVLASMDLQDLKLVYRVLHAYLAEHPELMDTDFLIELQDFLHRRADEEGVDGTHHGAWDAWLGHEKATACEARLAQRRRIED